VNLSGTEAIVSAGWSKFVLSPLRVLHALEVVSLDVAAGVAGSALLVASLSHSGPVPVAVFVAMVSAVLAVYNLDHFLDGSQIDTEASPRRRRYREHRKLIVSTAFAAAVCGAASMAFLPRAALVGGAVLVAYQAIYFLGLKKGLRGTAKRLAAAGGWAAGIALPAWSVFGQRGEILLAACILAALGWINLQSYSLVESRPEAEEDTAPGVAMRAAAVTVAAMLLAFAFATHPEQSRSWCALVAVGAVQVFLRRLPLDLVHPVGEWSLALLGLLALS
jgi:hypothetical protein